VIASLSAINFAAFSVRKGEASREDAKRLLELFCQCVDNRTISARNQVAERLLEHVREAIQGYLSGENCDRKDITKLDSAFGMVRGQRGRPAADSARNEADEPEQMKMAADVLRERLQGKTHQKAVDSVANRWGWASSIIGKAWKRHRLSAVVSVRNDAQRNWTEEEVDRLRRILKPVDQEIRRIT